MSFYRLLYTRHFDQAYSYSAHIKSKSGRVVLQLGTTELELSRGIPSTNANEVVVVTEQKPATAIPGEPPLEEAR